MPGPMHTLKYTAVSFAIASSLLLVLMLGGCGGGSDTQATGTLQVALTDAAGPYDSVVVTIKEIRVVPTGPGAAATGSSLPLIATFSPARTIDVLSLQFAQQVLGRAVIPAGSYEQVRLVLEPNPTSDEPLNYVTLASDPLVKHPLDTPSGQQSGLKVPGKYTVAPGVLSAIALDLDPSKAIVSAGASGKYILKPTGIRIVQMARVLPSYGSLSGVIAPAAAWPTAVVSVIPVGETAAIASGTVNPEDGSFRAFVPAGAYSIRVSASGFAGYNSLALVPPVSYDVVVGEDIAAAAITLIP